MRWRPRRKFLRRLRFVTWGVLAAVLLALGWLNLIGLPDFLKTRLVTSMHERGVNLEFSRLRLRFVRGLVAENVRVGDAKNSEAPVFNAAEIQLQLDLRALWQRKLLLNGLVLRDGKLTVPVSPTNSLLLTSLQARLRFQTNDVWSLNYLTGDFAGAKLSLAGEVVHARELKNLELFAGKKPRPPRTGASPLQQFSDTLAKIKFEGAPLISLNVNGDARDLHSFIVRLNVRAPAVRTPWFSARNLEAAANLTAPENAPTNFDAALSFWTNAQPFRLAWTIRANGLKTEKINAAAAEIGGVWNAPELSVTHLNARLGGGNLQAAANLNVVTRVVTFTNESDFDFHAVAGILTPKTRDRLAQIVWTKPPHVQAEGSLRLPPWTARAADWREDIEPTLQLHGDLEFSNAIAGGANLDSVRTHFFLTNMMWQLPDLELAQAGTRIHVSGHEDETTKNFSAHLTGAFDAESIRPFLTTSNAQRGFGHLTFNEPLALNLDVTGNIREFAQLAATGRIALTNFAIRRQTVDWLTTAVAYTNLTGEFFHPQISRAGGKQNFAAEKITLDIAAQKLFFHDAAGHIEPQVVARAIGPKTARAMEPYEFLSVPDARVNGVVPLHHEKGELVTDDADLNFEIVGTVPFRWRKFETTAITGTIHWWKNFIVLTNVVAECYGGEARGGGSFDVHTTGDGTEFNFFINGTNVDVHRMGMALWSRTNKLEGALSGEVTVTRADSDDWRSWNGFGAAKLREGLLWDVPVIGLVSPALNTVSPGLGNSQATEATGNFILTNGLIVTDSLEIRTPLMRLNYDGTVDLRQNVDARVTAQLLRNTPLLGSLFSMVLWPVSKIFEFRVTGTLGEPKLAPVHALPKLLLAPLHPIRSMEGIFNAPNTNSPPPATSTDEKHSGH